MKYCKYCGKELDENQRCDCENSKKEFKLPVSKDKIKPVAVISAIGVVVLAVVIYFISLLTSTVNLADYIVVDKVSGLNGQGEITCSIDEDALRTALYGSDEDVELTAKNVDRIIRESIEEEEELEALLECINISATPENALSNGDTVKITAVFENTGKKGFSHHIKKGTLDYKIEGLKEGKSFEPFAEDVLNVTFKGFNGKGALEYESNLNDELNPFIEYEFDKTEKLSNGDKVTATIKFNSGKLEQLGYFKPESIEKTYIVEDLPEFIKSASELPSSTVSLLKETAMEKANATMVELKEVGFSIVEKPEIAETFFVNVNNPEDTHKDSWYGLNISNGVLVMTHIKLKSGFSIVDDYWYTYLFPDCYLTEDNEVKYDEEHFTEFSTLTDSKKKAVEWLNEKFSDMTVTVLK